LISKPVANSTPVTFCRVMLLHLMSINGIKNKSMPTPKVTAEGTFCREYSRLLGWRLTT
jgi:hypothetical protein